MWGDPGRPEPWHGGSSPVRASLWPLMRLPSGLRCGSALAPSAGSMLALVRLPGGPGAGPQRGSAVALLWSTHRPCCSTNRGPTVTVEWPPVQHGGPPVLCTPHKHRSVWSIHTPGMDPRGMGALAQPVSRSSSLPGSAPALTTIHGHGLLQSRLLYREEAPVRHRVSLIEGVKSPVCCGR